jgi:hypothetical protein
MKNTKIHPFVRKSGLTEKEFYLKYPTDQDYFNDYPEDNPEYAEGGQYKSKKGTGTWNFQNDTYFQIGGAILQNSDAPIKTRKGKIDKSVYLPHPAIHKFEEGGEVENIDLTLQGIKKDLMNSFINTNQKYVPRVDRSADENLKNVTHYSTKTPKPEEEVPYALGGNIYDLINNKFQQGGQPFYPQIRQHTDYVAPTVMTGAPQIMPTRQKFQHFGSGSLQSSFSGKETNSSEPGAPQTNGTDPYANVSFNDNSVPQGCENDLTNQQTEKYGGRVYQDGGNIANDFNDDAYFSMLKYGGIHIKPSHEGRFTAYKKRTGKTTEEALHSKDPHVRQMANFSRNSKAWHHKNGGPIFQDGGDTDGSPIGEQQADFDQQNANVQQSVITPDKYNSGQMLNNNLTGNYGYNTTTDPNNPNNLNNPNNYNNLPNSNKDESLISENSYTKGPTGISPDQSLIPEDAGNKKYSTHQKQYWGQFNPMVAVDGFGVLNYFQNQNKQQGAIAQQRSNNLTSSRYAAINPEGSKGDYLTNASVGPNFRPNEYSISDTGFKPNKQAPQQAIGKYGGSIPKAQFGTQLPVNTNNQIPRLEQQRQMQSWQTNYPTIGDNTVMRAALPDFRTPEEKATFDNQQARRYGYEDMREMQSQEAFKKSLQDPSNPWNRAGEFADKLSNAFIVGEGLEQVGKLGVKGVKKLAKAYRETAKPFEDATMKGIENTEHYHPENNEKVFQQIPRGEEIPKTSFLPMGEEIPKTKGLTFGDYRTVRDEYGTFKVPYENPNKAHFIKLDEQANKQLQNINNRIKNRFNIIKNDRDRLQSEQANSWFNDQPFKPNYYIDEDRGNKIEASLRDISYPEQLIDHLEGLPDWNSKKYNEILNRTDEDIQNRILKPVNLKGYSEAEKMLGIDDPEMLKALGININIPEPSFKNGEFRNYNQPDRALTLADKAPISNNFNIDGDYYESYINKSKTNSGKYRQIPTFKKNGIFVNKSEYDAGVKKYNKSTNENLFLKPAKITDLLNDKFFMNKNKFGGKFQIGGEQSNIPDLEENSIVDLNPSQIKSLMQMGFQFAPIKNTKTRKK